LIVDLSRALAGPNAAMMMGDLGAPSTTRIGRRLPTGKTERLLKLPA
jgi:hypothetical protein